MSESLSAELEPIAEIRSAALSLPISEAVQRLENLQQSHDASHRDVADALRLLPQVELQISGLTKKFDNFVVGVESHTQSQADKERTKAACESKQPSEQAKSSKCRHFRS